MTSRAEIASDMAVPAVLVRCKIWCKILHRAEIGTADPRIASNFLLIIQVWPILGSSWILGSTSIFPDHPCEMDPRIRPLEISRAEIGTENLLFCLWSYGSRRPLIVTRMTENSKMRYVWGSRTFYPFYDYFFIKICKFLLLSAIFADKIPHVFPF